MAFSGHVNFKEGMNVVCSIPNKNNFSKTLKVCTLLSEVEAPYAMQVGERERTKGKGETETRENLSQ
jgi:hypothetical protein